MKKMQKIFALILTVSMLTAVFSGCAARDPEDRGAHIHMWLGADPTNMNFDPGIMMVNAETVKWIGLVLEGLMVMDHAGRLTPGIAEDWEILERDEDGNTLAMRINLRETRWSDGVQVAAEDFLNAWERILQPDFSSPAAALLFDIKNARAVKEGELTVADIGLIAPDLTVIEVTFERGIDHNRFLQNLASIALVPIRAVPVGNFPNEWAREERGHAFFSNGPFHLTNVEENRRAVLERSTYYRLDPRRNQAFDRYVRPHRLYSHFDRTLDAIATAFHVDGTGIENIFFLGDVPRERFEEFRNRAELIDMLSAQTLHFNTNVAPFGRPEVRRALSMALDRNRIADLVGLGVKPATGIVPVGTVGVNPTGADFRSGAGQVINPAADVAGARSLLQSAGVTSGSFDFKHRDTPTDREVAEYIAGVWRDLGFTVNLVPLRGRAFEEDALSVNYHVMMHDLQAPGVCAFSVLAPFAMPFSGSAKTFNPAGGYWEPSPYITGFQDDAYDALIEEIFLIDDNAARDARLREAERMLVDLMPVAPLYFNTSVNISDQRLSGITYSRFGFPVFTRTTLRNHRNYTTTLPPRD